MARKKEYSADEESSAQRSPRPCSTANAHSPPSDISSRKQIPQKRKDQSSPSGSSASAVYDVGELRAQLGPIGLTLRDIPGDGNCLFRALGDQLDGHSLNHLKHRMDTVRYMIANRKHFEPFIDVPFDRYMDNLSRPGTYAGQDALVAFARLHKVNIVIHQLNSPLWQIEGCDSSPHGGSLPELHLSYHNGEHYSSVRRFGDSADAPAHICMLSNLMGATEVPCCVSQSSVSTVSSPVTSHVANFASGPSPTAFPTYAGHPSASPTSPHAPPASESDSHGYIHNDDDHFSVLLQEVMVRSGCRDTSMATEALLESGGDVDHTVEYLLSLALFLEPVEPTEARTLSPRCERDVSLDKDFIEEVIPRRRVSNRRNVTAEHGSERRRVNQTQPSRARAHEVQQVISTGRTEKRNRKQSSTGKSRGGEKQRDAEVERDLRFLTL